MLKRANKITALLVAATSIMSLVPAMAADTTRLGTKEGTIQNAVAFSDGKYVYEGYRTDSEDDSVYYNAGDKDKELTDLTDADLLGSYETKYAFANDGSDQYLVDLSNGSVIDDEAVEDKADTAATKLKTALTKTDRYGDVTVTSANLGYTNENSTGVLPGAKFGDVWYQYGVVANSSDAEDNLVDTNKLYGYTNATGKYIDASNLANIYAYSSIKDKVVKIEEFSNSKTAGVADDLDTDTKLQAELLTKPEYLAQDKDYIYQKVNVKITDGNISATSAGQAATAKVNFPTTDTDVTTSTSAAATFELDYSVAPTTNDTVDTITIAGKVFTFNTGGAAVANQYTNLIDLQTKARAWFSASANKVTGYTFSSSTDTFTADTKGAVNATVPAGLTTTTNTNAAAEVAVPAGWWTNGSTTAASYVVAGVTFDYSTAGGDTDYTSLASLKAKVKAYFNVSSNLTTEFGAGNYTFNDSTFTFKAKDATVLGAVAKFAGDTDTDVTTEIAAGSGKTWETTYIQKIAKAQGENKDEALLPKTVASYELSDNLYDSDDADDAVDADNESTSYQVTNGTLFAIKNTGSNVKVTTMNLKKDKVKFNGDALPAAHSDIADKVDVYLVEKGDDDDTDVEATGAVSIDVDGNIWAINEGKIYKFESGEFKVQFTTDSSMDQLDVYDAKSMIAWEDSGDVYTTVNEGTTVTQDESTAVAPVVVTGWVQDGANWSFNDATGTKVTSKWVNVGGAWYFLKADGVMATSWYNDNGTWYYLKSSGAMATGWVNDNGTWYYCNASGAMLANTTVDGYVLNASGAWVK